MTASDRPREPAPNADEPPADEEYARTYAAGYEEGLRTALRELLAHVSRGRTSLELRALIQSRLAGLAEEVALKRRNLLAPPRPRPFSDLERSGRAVLIPGTYGTPPPRLAPLAARATVLVREARPRRALELLRTSRGAFPRLAVVSLHPPDLGEGPGVPLVLPPRDTAGATAGPASLSEVGGRLREPLEATGGALVYVDALEFFVTEEGAEMALRFVRWLVEAVQRSGSALVVSYDPRALAVTDASRLERLFGEVVDGGDPPRAPPA